ncbi:hypothetical protein B0H14DRAFT_3872248 [Mycena olivaceomarginata]|nr:hypothetical protein B0H14DRAFT_3872248 [Mycena olivaceomarginata]
MPVPSPPRCCILSPRPSHPLSTPLPRPPSVRCHARSVQPPPAPTPPHVVRASAALATPFRPASTCAAPRTLFGTPVSLCAHETVVSFATGGAAAIPVPFRLHPHMLRTLVPVSTRPSQSTSTPAPLAHVLPVLPPCTPLPIPPSTHLSLYRHASLVIRTAAAPPSFAPASAYPPACGMPISLHLHPRYPVHYSHRRRDPRRRLFMARLSSHVVIPSLVRDMTDPSEFNTMIDWVFVVATSIYALIGSAWYNAALNHAAL